MYYKWLNLKVKMELIPSQTLYYDRLSKMQLVEHKEERSKPIVGNYQMMS
jgi:hypothetical protein